MYFSLTPSLLMNFFFSLLHFFVYGSIEKFSPDNILNCPNITCTPYNIDLQNVSFDTSIALRISDLSPNFEPDFQFCDQIFYISIRNAQGKTLLTAPDSVNLSCAFFAEATTFQISNLTEGDDNYCWSTLTISNADFATCNERFQDSLALVNLYRNMDGPNWPQPWDLTQPINTWQGVTLNANDRVRRLSIFNLATDEPAPEGFHRILPDLNLTQLEFLRLINNNLSGELLDFSYLSKLESMYLGNNLLEGNIPDFSALPNLKVIDLRSNLISGSIPDLQLPLLEILALQNNRLSGGIPDFTYLSELAQLYLSNNRFTHEDFLPYLDHLQAHITSNSGYLSLLPQSNIPFLSPLVGQTGEDLIIDLGIDDTVTTNSYRWYKDGQLIQTIEGDNEFLIEDFQLTDAGTYRCDVFNPAPGLGIISTRDIIVYHEFVPNGACRAADSLALVQLYQATDGPNWTTNWDLEQPMENWFGVYLNDNGCVDCLDLDGSPDCDWSTKFGNNLSGSLPDLNLPNLRLLFLEANELTGTLPNFSHLTNLIVLVLNDNKLSGSIPDFSNFPSLSGLFLNENDLSGSIPNFSNAPKLQDLILANNQLYGNIPDFTNIPFLNIVDLRGNLLIGSIPDFSSPNFIQYLYLENNLLSGEIPNFSNLPYLNGLYLTNNKLEGCLPDFSNSPDLFKIELENNMLDCNIPNLDHLTGLKGLSIGNNNFTFEDIFPTFSSITNLISNNTGGSPEFYRYFPQEKFYPETFLEATEGESLVIDLVIDDGLSDNLYQWFKNGNPLLELQGVNELTFDQLQLNDTGIYYCVVTNPNVPELSLISREIILMVEEAALEFCDDINLTFNQTSIPEGVHRAAELIESSGTVSNNTTVTFVAGQNIQLLPGFQTGNQVAFHAYIENCEIVPESLVKRNLPETKLIDQIKQPTQLSIFPNPSQSFVNLQYRLSKPAEVSIYITNLSGNIVRAITTKTQKESGVYTHQVDLQDLASGMYYVQLISNDSRDIQKLSVIK